MVAALIIRKPTNLEQHQALEAKKMVSSEVDPQYQEFLKKAHVEHYECLATLKAVLNDSGIVFDETLPGATKPNGNYDFVVALGGDGTLITSSYFISDSTPLIGIKSSSASVGFLCAGEKADIPSLIHAYQDGSLRYIERHRIYAHIRKRNGRQEKSTIAALNDVLFAADNPASTTRYQIGFLNRVETHKSSGIWIATATGSTAAIGAAGGTMMSPQDNHFQFLVRELYLKVEEGLLLSHGFCDPSKDLFWIESRIPNGMLALDGEKLTMKVEFGDRISFSLASPVRVARKI
jgi:NAD+ kinase